VSAGSIKVKQLSVVEERFWDFIRFVKNNIPADTIPDFEREIEEPAMRAIKAGDPIDMGQLLAYMLLPKYKLDEHTLMKKVEDLVRSVTKDYQTYVSTTFEVAKSRRNKLLRKLA